MGFINERMQKNLDYKCDELPPFPKDNFLIEVTNFCNHSCVFCANSKMTRPKRLIDDEIVYKSLSEAYDLGVHSVGFYACGEPLINENLELYIRRAKEIGYEYTYLTTNGALLDPKRANSIIDAGIDSIKFSINAGNRKTYRKVHGKDDFCLVLRNLERLASLRKEKKFKIAVSSVLTSFTLKEKTQIIQLVQDFTDDIVFVNVLNQGGWMNKENENIYVDALRPILTYPCNQPFNRMTITCEGYLTACCYDFQNYLAVADLHEMTLKEAWECQKFKEIRRRHIEGDLDGTICNNCIHNKMDKATPIDVRYATVLDDWNLHGYDSN